jgi:hypothetical protein
MFLKPKSTNLKSAFCVFLYIYVFTFCKNYIWFMSTFCKLRKEMFIKKTLHLHYTHFVIRKTNIFANIIQYHFHKVLKTDAPDVRMHEFGTHLLSLR